MSVSVHHTYSVTFAADVDAEPQRVYHIIADYHHGHPRVLPKQFKRLTVERGGIGAGTEIRFDVHVFGRAQTFRAVVSEPEPGRVLVERNVEPNDSVTTFTVEPVGAHAARVTIATELRSRTGLLGAIERFLTTKVLLPMYKEEIRLLEQAAREPSRPVP